MTYTLKDIKHLEVMADLLNATPAEPEKIDISALIASDVEHEETVDEKILSLCGKLRADGFDKHADSLESKFMAYKSASVHMYRVHDEDGEDVINFAHPDGDTKIEEASDNLGDVETIVSRHKKMVDVVNKTPTGKLAAYIARCKTVLAQGTPNSEWTLIKNTYDIDTLYNMGFQKLKDVFNEVLMKEELDELILLGGGTDRIGALYNDMASWSNLNSATNHLEAMNSSIDRFKEKRPVTAQLIKIVGYYENMFETLINKVDAIPAARKNQYINKARIAWGYLTKAKEKIQEGNTPASTQPGTTNIIEVKNLEVNKLKLWKEKIVQKQMGAEQKSHIDKWIDGQIAELQNATTPEQVNKVVEEDKRFEAKGLI